jgi:hypothetical protein
MSTSARGPAPTEKSAARLWLHALRVEPVARAWYWRGSCVPLHPRRAHLRNAQHIESICARDIHIATRASVRSCILVAIGMPSTSTPVDGWKPAPARAWRQTTHRRSPFKSTVLRVVSGGDVHILGVSSSGERSSGGKPARKCARTDSQPCADERRVHAAYRRKARRRCAYRQSKTHSARCEFQR